MASIKRPVLSVRQEADGDWAFTVNYTAVFDASELNAEFQDCIELFERDFISADDLLTSKGCQDFEGPFPPLGFEATRLEVPRTREGMLSDRETSTEVGNEEIYAVVNLLNPRKPNPFVAKARTNELEVRT